MSKFIISILFLLLSFSCSKKETITQINGVVRNAVTGLPMKNVSTWIIASDYPSGQTFSDTSITNSNGEYDLSVKGTSIDAIIMYAFRPGFVDYKYEPIDNTSITKDILLYPLDSYITFNITNKLNYRDFLYGSYWSTILKHQFLSAYYDYPPVPYGTTFTETRNCPGDTFIYVTWDYFEYNTQLKFPNLDSIYVPRGDTAVYEITM